MRCGRLWREDRSVVSAENKGGRLEKKVGIVRFLKRPTNALECMNLSLLYGNDGHVSAIHVAIFRVARTRIQPP
jgi:hypothetical protein